jgi:hypothetical protein
MENNRLILIDELCGIYELEFIFFESLRDADLIEIIVIEEKRHIHEDHIAKIEQIIRLHRELDVNIAGIDIILNLLQKVNTLSEELQELKNKLS